MKYPGYMTREDFGYTYKDGWTTKGWDAWMEYREAMYAYWAANAKRRFHALPEDKGIPVPHTGSRRWHSGKNSGKAGVIGNSRVLPHRYMDEGDKGAQHNRHIKRVERALWRSEALEELRDDQEGYSVSGWYAGVFGQEDADAWYDWDHTDWSDYECEFCNGPCTL